jgi:hypothetical protein
MACGVNLHPVDFKSVCAHGEAGSRLGTGRALPSSVRQHEVHNLRHAPKERNALEAEEGRAMKTKWVWLAILVVCLIPVLASAQERSSNGRDGARSAYQSNPPTYAIHLNDGRTALVWLDARNDPARPQWKCEVPPRGDGSEASMAVLKADKDDWRGALLEATANLNEKALVADGQ